MQNADWEKNERLLGLEQTKWHRRIVTMSQWIHADDRIVMDLGAGNMHLKHLLPAGAKYIPVDYKKRFDETVVCDFNKGEFPKEFADVIVCAGIIGYIKKPFVFLDQAMHHCKKILLSCHRDGADNISPIVEYLAKHGFFMTRQNMDFDEWPLLACFEKMEPQELAKNIQCTGCGACANICPQDAIAMVFDEDGFLRPKVDVNRCVQCKKCIQVCPTRMNKIDENDKESPLLYVAWAEDALRQDSSSGGIFPLAAKYVLENGGVVFGAAWTEDFYCRHKGIQSDRELHELRRSKYVQSNIGMTFREVRGYLKQSLPVLFAGCPCQIAGLKAYLGDEVHNGNLLTIDVVCAYTPSITVFRKYLDETYGIENVADVEMRCKDKTGWSAWGLCVVLKNGQRIYPEGTADNYLQYFLNGFRNDVCENCQYMKFPRQGDITLGDFWGIGNDDPSWNDGKGTSLVLVNTKRGRVFLEKVQSLFIRWEQVPLTRIQGKGNAFYGERYKSHANRKYFQKLWREKRYSFGELVNKSLSGHHDIGLVCYTNNNLGNNLVNYALYQYLTTQGWSVLMIDPSKEAPFVRDAGFITTGNMRNFLRKVYPSYDLARSYDNKIEMDELNALCDFFVLGGDQIFRALLVNGTNFHSCMEWVHSDKYKMAYGTSFGDEIFTGDESLRARMEFFFHRFQRLGLREESGINILKEEFHCKGVQVIDPVFLCGKEVLLAMAAKGTIRLPENPFVGAYILDPTANKEALIQGITKSGRLAASLTVLDTEIYFDGKAPDIHLKTLSQPMLEEMLAVVAQSEFFVTDSFHGICLALIFQKPFCVVWNTENEKRGWARVQSLLSRVGLLDRVVKNYEEFMERGLLQKKVDHEYVGKTLYEFRTKSIDWLKSCLNEAKTFRHARESYDFLLEEKVARKENDEELRRCDEELKRQNDEHLQKIKAEMERNTERLQEKILQEIYVLKQSVRTERITGLQLEGDGDMQIVGWGAGDCFGRNIHNIKTVYDLRWVCDNDPEKWGTEIAPGVKCISPRKLREMEDVLVIVMIDSPAVSFKVANQLLDMGICRFDHVSNWMKAVKGRMF